MAAFGLKDFRTAEGDSSLVLKANPRLYSMLTTRAAARNELGRHAEALRDAREALALAPAKEAARPRLEVALAREGLREDPGSVLEEYKTASELDPSFSPDYPQALSRLKTAQAQDADAAVLKEGGPKRSAAGGAEGLVAGVLPPGFPAKRAAALSAALIGLLALGVILARAKAD